MGRLLFYDMIDKPVTTIIIGACSAIWLLAQKRGLGYADLGVSYDSVVSGGQHWRLLTSSLTHISFLHLMFNMSSLWSLGIIETLANLGLGIRYYLHNTLVLLLLSSLLVLGLYHILIHQFKLDYYKQVTAVGYSCVVFGWMTILAVKRPSSKLNLFGLLSLPISYAPFESLVFTSIIVPQASFLGHLSGILAGYLVAWNVFQGMDDYWAVTIFTWMVLLFIVSLKRTSRYDLRFIEIDQTIPGVGLVTPIAPVERVEETSGVVGSDLV
jgi:membrane associated rhomboid family serine protease